MNWWIWRLVASDFLTDGLSEIRHAWTFPDTLEAHLALDALEEVRDYYREQDTK